MTLLLRALGVRPDRDGVWLDNGRIVASFGAFSLAVDLANVDDLSITGPYSPLKSIGPRLSLADHGLTFGTSWHCGVCVQFIEPIDPVIGPWRHPGLTLTLDDPEHFVRAIGRAR